MRINRKRINRRRAFNLGVVGLGTALVAPSLLVKSPTARARRALEHPAMAGMVMDDSGGAAGPSPSFTPFSATLPANLSSLLTLPQTPLTPAIRADMRQKLGYDLPDGSFDYYEVTAKPATVQVLPEADGWPQTLIWGYNGRYPGPIIAGRGCDPDDPTDRACRTVVVRHTNLTPEHTSVHAHGAHTPPQWDGYACDLVEPGFSKYHVYPNDQVAAPLWYHDHADGLTGKHVYMGLAGVMPLSDRFEDALGLPTGDFDLPIVLQDRLFTAGGQFQPYNTFSHNGFLGDTFLVNGRVQPRMEVDPRRYRLRFLCGSNARVYDLVLRVRLPGQTAFQPGRTFFQVASEGGLLPAVVERANIEIAPGERHDAIVDFIGYPPGTQVVIENRMLQTDGRKPDGIAASPDQYAPMLRFEVVAQHSGLPPVGPAEQRAQLDALLVNGHTLRPRLKPLRAQDAARTRRFDLGRSGGEWTINNVPFANFDCAKPAFYVPMDATEIWEFQNGGGWVHPMHIHDIESLILSRNGAPPPPWEAGPKDMFYAHEGENVRVLSRFRDNVFIEEQAKGAFAPFSHLGDAKIGAQLYVLHCHNLEHEDHDMMFPFQVVAPNDPRLKQPGQLG